MRLFGMRLFGPIHTADSVADQLIRGLEDGTITLDGREEKAERPEDGSWVDLPLPSQSDDIPLSSGIEKEAAEAKQGRRMIELAAMVVAYGMSLQDALSLAITSYDRMVLLKKIHELSHLSMNRMGKLFRLSAAALAEEGAQETAKTEPPSSIA